MAAGPRLLCLPFLPPDLFQFCASTPVRKAMSTCFHRWYGAGLFLLVALVCFSGCTSEPPLPPLFPVKGTVKVGTDPVKSGQVTLFPETASAESKLPPSTGQIN